MVHLLHIYSSNIPLVSRGKSKPQMRKHLKFSLKEFQKKRESTLKSKNVNYLCFQVGFSLYLKGRKNTYQELGKSVRSWKPFYFFLIRLKYFWRTPKVRAIQIKELMDSF